MEDDKTSSEVNIHIMHSMKGGCGKSTCALFKAIQIAYNSYNIDDKSAHVLFIDADFKGSALMEILFRTKDKIHGGTDSEEKQEDIYSFSEKQKEIKESVGAGKEEKGDGQYHILAVPDNFDNYKTLSDYLRDSSQYSIMDIICHSFSYENEYGNRKERDKVGKSEEGEAAEEGDTASAQKGFINGYIDFVLSSASAESKDWFRYTEGKIPAGVYKWRMEALLRNVLKIETVNSEAVGTYTDIVIDMPPGYDEYSDILLGILRDIARKETNVKLHYYAVTTEDIGHDKLAGDNIKKMINADGKFESFTSVNFILSAVSANEFVNITNRIIKKYENCLEVDGKIYGKVHKNEYSESFHSFCRDDYVKGFVQDVREVLENISST